MDLNEHEIDLMLYMIGEVWDKMVHYPNDWTPEESAASSSLHEKVKLAEKQLRSERK